MPKNRTPFFRGEFGSGGAAVSIMNKPKRKQWLVLVQSGKDQTADHFNYVIIFVADTKYERDRKLEQLKVEFPGRLYLSADRPERGRTGMIRRPL